MNFIGPYSDFPLHELPRYRPGRPIDIRKIQTAAGFPITLEEVKADLRVDSDDEDATIERIMRGAAGFLERRTGCAFLAGRYEATFDDWLQFGFLEFQRYPFRSVIEVAWFNGTASPPSWEPVDLVHFFVAPRSASFVLTPLSTFNPPQVWAPCNGCRVRFEAGYDIEPQSGEDQVSESSDADIEALPIDGDGRMLLTAAIAHFYENRELFLADKVAEVEASAGSLFTSRRKYW